MRRAVVLRLIFCGSNRSVDFVSHCPSSLQEFARKMHMVSPALYLFAVLNCQTVILFSILGLGKLHKFPFHSSSLLCIPMKNTRQNSSMSASVNTLVFCCLGNKLTVAKQQLPNHGLSTITTQASP